MSFAYPEYPPRREPPSPDGSRAPLLIGGVVLLLLGGVLGWWFWPFHRTGGDGRDPSAVPRPVTQRGPYWPEEQLVVELYEKARASVVSIRTNAGSGTGFIWDREGRVVTNHH